MAGDILDGTTMSVRLLAKLTSGNRKPLAKTEFLLVCGLSGYCCRALSIVYEKPLMLKYDIDLFINNYLLRYLDFDSCYLKKRERRRYSVNLKDTY